MRYYRGIIHVCQAILETGSGRQLAIMVEQLAILTYPTMVFLLLTWSTGPMEPLIGVNNVKPMSGGG
jgi:hypothetical protein